MLTRLPEVVIHTDGSCYPNPGGAGGWAFVMVCGGRRQEISGGDLGPTTCNRMEIIAAIRALEFLEEPSLVDLWTDSQYLRTGAVEWSVKWKKTGWTRRVKGKGIPMRSGQREPIPNADLWRELEFLKDKHRVRWHWIRGHATEDNENNCCDKLAKARQEEQRSLRNLMEI